jgi:2-polyprenyl-6-methoxyphenol hydroxylase-like FAD-dependent oxidoreductase
MEPSPSVAIIGGGPSGLVFARLLELNGITDYIVYERDQSATPGQWQQGGTLDLHAPSGQLALKRADLFDEFSKFARWDASCFRVLDQEGSNVFNMEGRDAPEIDRLQLRQLLLDSVPVHKVRWGSPVASVEKIEDSHGGINNKGYTIHFTDGTLATGFCLVVGADGVWSKVRPLVSQAPILLENSEMSLTILVSSLKQGLSTRAKCSSRASYHTTIHAMTRPAS